ncbi:MAG: hypothetical protein H6845_01510 [Alphaproteobacteria bacterium]|nr:MAG: hypothetical protein H6845_01510 [Alphaproteobacteria bacterium]
MQLNKLITHLGTSTSKRIYEATHDSDLVRLRDRTDGIKNGATGLYSYYTKVLQDYYRDVGTIPEIATTGYRAEYEEDRYIKRDPKYPNQCNDTYAKAYYGLVYQAIEVDRYVRAAVSKVDGRASYIPEPNALFLVPKGKFQIPHSFLGFNKNKKSVVFGKSNNYDPQESSIILRQIYGANDSAGVLFCAKHPIWMRVPERMLQYKKHKSNFDPNKLGYLKGDQFFITDGDKLFKFAAELAQTPFSYRDYAATLYSQLKVETIKKQKNPDKTFKALVCTAFNYYEAPEGTRKFEPTEGCPKYIKNIDSLIEYMNKTFKNNLGETLKNIATCFSATRRQYHNAFVDNTQTRESVTSIRRAISTSLDRNDSVHPTLPGQPLSHDRAAKHNFDSTGSCGQAEAAPKSPTFFVLPESKDFSSPDPKYADFSHSEPREGSDSSESENNEEEYEEGSDSSESEDNEEEYEEGSDSSESEDNEEEYEEGSDSSESEDAISNS